jgi:hypothetical protein
MFKTKKDAIYKSGNKMLYLNYLTQVDILLKVKAQFSFEFLQISCFMQILLHIVIFLVLTYRIRRF